MQLFKGVLGKVEISKKNKNKTKHKMEVQWAP